MNNLMERYQLEALVHSRRFEVMQHYLVLYGERLKGKPNLYERYNNGQTSPSSEDGMACMEALMSVEHIEKEISMLVSRIDAMSKILVK